MRPIALVLALVTLSVGCFGPTLEGASVEGNASPPVYDLADAIVERIPLAARDGIMLDVAVWRPATDEKVPIIVDIGPYFGNLGGDMMTLTAIDLRLAEYFLPRGYAIARGSVRGTGASEGCFDLGGPTERRDVADIVDHLGKQPWSNGNVAQFGKSYDGTTPYMAAIEKPEHLRTIVPVSGVTGWYRYSFYDGVAYPETAGFNAYYYLLVDHDIGTSGPYNVDPQHALLKNVVRDCHGLLEHALPQAGSTLSGDHGDPFWVARDYEPRWSEIEVPVFMVHGLQDWNVKPDNSVPMFNGLDVPRAMWLGQWAHDYPDINRWREDWGRSDWNETLLTWFDHHLKGVENDWERLLKVEVQDQTGVWRNWTTWPPPEAYEASLHLTAEGGLALDAASGTATVGGPLGAALEFATPPLTQAVLISGQPILDLTLSADRPLGHVTVALYAEDAGGIRVPLDHGARDIRHRNGRDTGTMAPIGQAFAMNVTMYPQELYLPAGQRLVLVVAAEDRAHWVPSPAVGASYTIDLGASALRLPVSMGSFTTGAGTGEGTGEGTGTGTGGGAGTAFRGLRTVI